MRLRAVVPLGHRSHGRTSSCRRRQHGAGRRHHRAPGGCMPARGKALPAVFAFRVCVPSLSVLSRLVVHNPVSGNRNGAWAHPDPLRDAADTMHVLRTSMHSALAWEPCRRAHPSRNRLRRSTRGRALPPASTPACDASRLPIAGASPCSLPPSRASFRSARAVPARRLALSRVAGASVARCRRDACCCPVVWRPACPARPRACRWRGVGVSRALHLGWRRCRHRLQARAPARHVAFVVLSACRALLSSPVAASGALCMSLATLCIASCACAGILVVSMQRRGENMQDGGCVRCVWVCDSRARVRRHRVTSCASRGASGEAANAFPDWRGKT